MSGCKHGRNELGNAGLVATLPVSGNSYPGKAVRAVSVALEQPDLARRLTVVRQPRKLPLVLSAQEAALLREAARGPTHKAALSVAYGAGLHVAEAPGLQRPAEPVQRIGAFGKGSSRIAAEV